MNKVKYLLVASEGCPYAQRIHIILREKGVEYESKNIDLRNKPDWFLQRSPLGKVPLFCLGEVSLFDSFVIGEYLEDAFPAAAPLDPLQRGLSRSWILYGSELMGHLGKAVMAKDKAEFEIQLQHLKNGLGKLESHVPEKGFFLGPQFNVIDAAYAPFFQCFRFFEKLEVAGLFADLPKTELWKNRILAHQSVIAASPRQFPDGYRKHLEAMGAYIVS